MRQERERERERESKFTGNLLVSDRWNRKKKFPRKQQFIPISFNHGQSHNCTIYNNTSTFFGKMNGRKKTKHNIVTTSLFKGLN